MPQYFFRVSEMSEYSHLYTVFINPIRQQAAPDLTRALSCLQIAHSSSFDTLFLCAFLRILRNPAAGSGILWRRGYLLGTLKSLYRQQTGFFCSEILGVYGGSLFLFAFLCIPLCSFFVRAISANRKFSPLRTPAHIVLINCRLPWMPYTGIHGFSRLQKNQIRQIIGTGSTIHHTRLYIFYTSINVNIFQHFCPPEGGQGQQAPGSGQCAICWKMSGFFGFSRHTRKYP